MITNSMKLEIDKSALLHNYDHIKSLTKKEIIPVVKANSYGLGSEIITSILYEAGARLFSVARYSEAKQLIDTNKFPDTDILVFESIRDTSILANSKNLIFSANSMDDLKYLLDNGVQPDRIHIKLDLGFGRNGITEKGFTQLNGFMKSKSLDFGGLYSHLFSASDSDGKDCIDTFESFLSMLGPKRFNMTHILSSESFYQQKCDVASHIRIGQLIYGIQEPKHPDPDLQKVFSFKGKIECIKDIRNNKYIAYDPKKKIKNLRYFNIAMVKLGYGDGFMRQNENTQCLINNKEYDISSISMDNTFINVDDSVKEGDTVEFYYDTNKFYDRFKFKIYEYLTCLNDRIPRVMK